MTDAPDRCLIIACGALSHELVHLIEVNGLEHIDLTCLPAHWHHTPEKIPEGLRRKLRDNRDAYRHRYVMYGDCGTWGQIDRVIEEEGGERIAGPHCFSFLMGNEAFERYTRDEITTFYLTDFFCRFFDRFVWEGLGLDRRSDMVDFVFGNYRKVVYLAQTRNAELEARAEEIAARLKLDYEYRFCGYGDMEVGLQQLAEGSPARGAIPVTVPRVSSPADQPG